jgi:hypothetical protein
LAEIRDSRIEVHVRIRLISAVGVLGIIVALTALLLYSRAQTHAERSCVGSVFQVLSQSPELLAEIKLPVTNEWYRLDEETTAVLIQRLLARRLLDCKGLEPSLAQGRVGHFLKLQVFASSDGSRRVRVIGAGLDLKENIDDQPFRNRL